MNIRSSLKVMLLALAVSANYAANACDNLCDKLFDTNNWYVKPKIGVAPSVFAGRARQQLVVPRAGLVFDQCTSGGAPVTGCIVADGLLNDFANVLQETACLPKFSNMFNQGVLHVGFELGYQSCESSCPVFVEFVYNRASGRCQTPCNSYTRLATTGCLNNNNCSTNSSSSVTNSSSSTSSNCASSCSVTTQALNEDELSISNICGLKDNYSNYSAYGGYIGGRHFTNAFWCDSTSFWFGYKVGILHRKQVNSASTLTATSDCGANTDVNFCLNTQDITLNRAIFCKSNAISGGIQVGLDYDYSDCLAFQLGFEVVASSGLTGNRNLQINLKNLTATQGTNIGETLLQCANLPSNILIRNTGTLVQFPIWFGVRWDFGSLFNSCDAC